MKPINHPGGRNKTIMLRTLAVAASLFWGAIGWPSSCAGQQETNTGPRQSISNNLESMAVDLDATALGGQTVSGENHPRLSKLSRRLINLDWQQFERKIVDLWGDQLQATAENEEATVIRVQLPGSGEQPQAIIIDRNLNTVTFEGPVDQAGTWDNMVKIIDVVAVDGPGFVQLVGMGRAESATVRSAAALLGIQEDHTSGLENAIRFVPFRSPSGSTSETPSAAQTDPPQSPAAAESVPATKQVPASTASSRRAIPSVPGAGAVSPAPQPPAPVQQDPPAPIQDQRSPIVQLDDEPLQGTVQIKILDEFGTIVLIGAPEDTAKIRAIIENLVQQADQVQPMVEIIQLKNADAETIKPIIDEVYQTMFEPLTGMVTVQALPDSNSLLVIGQPEGQSAVADLVRRLDTRPPDTDDDLDFRLFRLKHVSAVDAAQQLRGYFFTPASDNETVPSEEWITSVHGPVSIILDYRSNSVIVKGNAEVLRRAENLINKVDVEESESRNVVRVFHIRNAVASDLAQVLQNAINGGLSGAPQAFTPGAEQFGQQQQNLQQNALARARAAMLEIMTIDGSKRVTSGALFDVQVSANSSSNQVIVTGPEESMDLIAELIRQLDQIPDAETFIKVYQIEFGDASQLLTMLQTLFGQSQGGGVGGAFGQNTGNLNNLPLQTASATVGSSLLNLRFSVEPRTNSIIASGSEGDLRVVEDLLYRLDEQDNRDRINDAYRLKNAAAEDVALAINQWLDSRQDVIDTDPTSSNPFTNARSQVIVVAEIVTNSLIVSATPRFYDEVMRLIQQLDQAPAMVKVNVMLAEVRLDEFSEFGIEFGIQDSLVFDRGLGVIGFPFNQAGIGNNNDAISLATRELLAGQALSNLNVGRTNSTLGYGGLVLSAGNESINVLLRALEDRGVIRILSTPSLTTVENLQGRVQVGQNVARVRGVTPIAGTGGVAGGSTITTNVEDVPTGIILEITPRVSPDGMIIMNVDAINSELGDESEGTVVFQTPGSVPVRSPPINIIQAQTTVMARSGQTVAFSGLIQDTTVKEHRGTPILSDLPVIGPLFSYEADAHRRDELLIIMTPYIMNSNEEIAALNQSDMDRMHWCLADVADVFGTVGYGEFDPGNLGSEAPATYYPDDDPAGVNPQYVPLESGAEPPVPGQVNPFSQPTVPSRLELPGGVDTPVAPVPADRYELPPMSQPGVPDASDGAATSPVPAYGVPQATRIVTPGRQIPRPGLTESATGPNPGESNTLLAQPPDSLRMPNPMPAPVVASEDRLPQLPASSPPSNLSGNTQQVAAAAPLLPVIRSYDPKIGPDPTGPVRYGRTVPLPRVEYLSGPDADATAAGDEPQPVDVINDDQERIQKIKNPFFK